MKCVKVGTDQKAIRDFLRLPKKLYQKNTNVESESSMKSLLLGTHLLSHYFSLDSYVIYDEVEAAGRFAITRYPEEDVAYLGFFECVERKEVAAFLFENASRICREMKCQRIVGPVNSSFWMTYRLKINHFDWPPYTGEPYNREYYYQFFLNNGYTVKDHYTSNAYRAIDESYVNEKFEARYRSFLDQGYVIESPTMETYDKAVEDVYELISVLYSDFPVFKHISREDFKALFASYKSIMNMSMTKLAYYQGKAVGFYVSLPDYGNLVYHVRPWSIPKILRTRKKPKRYVMLYMGVDASHRGLGKALVYAVIRELEQNHLPSIGALARDGKVTQNYVSEEVTDVYEYVLLEKELT